MGMASGPLRVLVCLLVTWEVCLAAASPRKPSKTLSKFRAVLQTDFGDIHLGFYHEAAPQTVDLVFSLLDIGAYNTNHFFRVDRGFVAQVADVAGGRTARLDHLQQSFADKRVPLEVRHDLKHDKRGILSLARHSDPNSGGSSFSILLGPAPHLDMQYTVFGEVTKGLEVLSAMEGVETRREGIFVMPKDRITVHSSYTYWAGNQEDQQDLGWMRVTSLSARLNTHMQILQDVRQQDLPGK